MGEQGSVEIHWVLQSCRNAASHVLERGREEGEVWGYTKPLAPVMMVFFPSLAASTVSFFKIEKKSVLVGLTRSKGRWEVGGGGVNSRLGISHDSVLSLLRSLLGSFASLGFLGRLLASICGLLRLFLLDSLVFLGLCLFVILLLCILLLLGILLPQIAEITDQLFRG